MRLHRSAARAAAVLFVVLAFAGSALGATRTWTNNNGTGDGKWSTASNWSPASVPTASDDVEIGVTDQTSNYLVIDSAAAVANSVTIGNVFTNNPTIEIKNGYTLTISSASTIDAGATLLLNYGNVAGNGNLLVNGTFSFNGGQISGSGVVTVGSTGTVNFVGSSNYTYLTRNVTNNGTINYYSSAVYSHYFYTAAIVTNNGTIDILGDEDIFYSNGAANAFRIDNTATGVVRKSGGTGTAAIKFGVNNASGGTVQSLSGTLAIEGGGTSTGVFNATTGNVLSIPTGTYTFDPGATVTGTGKIVVGGNGILNVSSSADVTIPNLQLNGTSAKLDGSGIARIGTLLQWDGGTMSGGGTTIVTATASANIACGTYYCSLDSRSLNVAIGASATYTPSNYPLYFYNGSSLSLASGATLSIQTDLDFVYGGGTLSSITNAGSIQKTGGSAAFVFGVPLSSTGALSVSSGDMQIAAAATLNGGAINIGSTSNFDITTGYTTISNAVTVNNSGGSFRLAGGSLRISTGVTQSIQGFSLQSGSSYVDGAGTLQLTGTATWSAGSMGSSSATGGTTEVVTGATLNITGASSYAYLDYDRTLLNNGTVNYSSTTWGLYLYNQADITNNGTFDLQSDLGINIGGSGPRVFTNNNAVLKSGGTSASGANLNAEFDNAGTVTITSGRLNLAGGGTSSGSFDIGSGTYLQVTGNYDFSGTPSITGSGTLRVLGSGNLIVPTGVTLSVPNLLFDAGYISGGGLLRITAAATWSGGTMGHPTYPGGTTEVVLSASLTIDGVNGYTYLDQSRTLLNNNVINYTTPTYPLYLYGNTTLTNNGTINYSTDAGIALSGSGMLIANAGSISKTTGSGAATITAPLNNSGSIAVSSGSLLLGGNGTHNGGTFTATGTGVFGFSGGTHTLDASSSLTGTGTVAVSGGTVNVNGTYNPASLSVTSGTLALNSNGTAGVLLLTSSGVIGGSGTFTITDDSTWSGGTMSGTGTTVLSASKTLTISATTSYCYLDARTFTNNGTIQYPPSASNYYLYLYNSATFNNAGTFNVTNDQYLYGQSNGTFNNSGTFTKTAATGTTTVYSIFNNTGTVTVTSGILSFYGNGTHTGTFTPTSPGAIAFTSGTHGINSPASISGTGTLAINGGTVTSAQAFTVGTLKVTAGMFTINATSTADTLDMTNGTLNGNAAITLTNGGTWGGGTIGGTVSVTIPATKTLAITNSVTYASLDGSTLTNNGIINYTAGVTGYLQLYNGALLQNNNVFNYLTDQALYGASGGTFNNAGTFSRSSGSGSAAVSPIFNNTGAVSVTTGTLSLSGGGTHTGTWSVTSPATLAFTGGTHNATAGSISGTGTLSFTGATATFGIAYTVGALSISGGTATLNANGSADAFTMTNGTLGGTGTLTLNNGGLWSGGTMNGGGSVIVPVLKTFTIDDAVTYCTLDNRILTNNGTINYAPTTGAYLQLYNNAALNNAGVFNITAGTLIYGGTNGAINNTGTLNKSAGPSLDIYALLNNNNQLTVSAGTLGLAGGGTHANGVFTATSPGEIKFSGATHVLSGTGSMGGTGTYVVTGGTTTVGVPYNLAALSMSSGTINFDTTGTIGVLSMSYGTLGGSGTVTISDNSSWTGGTMNGTGTTVFSTGKTYTIGGANYVALETRTLTNNGTMNYVAPSYYFQIYSNGTLNNAGTLTLQTDLYLYGFSGGTINNTGTISRTTGTANATPVYPVLNNSGTISATTGSIELHGGGTHSGTFSATSPAAITFANGTHAVNATGSLTGTGRFRFTGGTVTVAGTWTGAGIDITNGTLNLETNGTASPLNITGGSGTLGGSGNITVGADSTWSAGNLGGSGTLLVNSGVTVTLSGASYLTLSRALQNDGTMSYTAPTYYVQMNGVTLTNNGTFDYQTGQILYAYGASPSFVNNGTLTKTAGTGVSQFYAPLTNSGTVQIGSGTLYFSAGYVQNAGTTELLNNAVLQTGTLDLNDGFLKGSGTINASVTNNGTGGVTPGASPGTLTITGNYTQGPNAALSVELGGITAGTQYDQLVVQGSATLDGTLNVLLINSFFPASGNTFQIMTFGSRPGSTDFATKNGLNLGSGTNLIDAYSATDLQLTTNSVQADMAITMSATPASVNNGGAFAWTVNVTNNGGSNASGAAVSMTIPANATFTGSSPAICTGAPNLVCTIGNLGAGNSTSITISANANGTGSTSTTATVSASQFDPNGANNTATAGTTIVANADLGVTITDSPDPVVAGSTLTYSFTVTNAGFDSASGVTLAVTPDSSLTFNSASAPCAGGFPCSLGTLGSGATSVINATYTVPPTASGLINLNASVSASSPADPNAANNSAAQGTTIVQSVDVQVIKTGPSTVPPDAGTTVTYTIAVTNNGPSVASSVTLDDPTPAGLTLQSVSGDCTALPCAIGTMPVAQTANVQVVYGISGAVGTTYTNTATITAAGDSNATNNSSSVATTISSCPSTSITAPPSVNGNSTGNAASVTNVAGATFSWSISNGTITAGAGTSAITFTAGPSGVVTLAVSVSAGACLSNPTTTVTIVSTDLQVTKTGPANVSPTTSSTITYTINVTNAGSSPASSVVLADPTPAGLTFQSATGACATFPCSLGTLTSNQSVSVQATYGFSAGAQQTVTNTATASTSTTDVNPANDSGSATTLISACPTISISGPAAMTPGASDTATATNVAGATYSWTITNGTIDSGQGTSTIGFTAGAAGTTTLNVTVTAGLCTSSASFSTPVNSTQADVGISKTAPLSVGSGATFAYTLAITNGGPAAADSVMASDTLPGAVSFVSVDSASCTGGAIVTCNFGTLAPGATQSVNITVTAPQGPVTLTNTAQVSTSTADPNAVNNSSTITTTVSAAPPTCPSTAPSLLTPNDGAGGVASPITFSWTAVSNAVSYELWIGPNAASLVLAGTTAGTSLDVALSSGTYAWQVLAIGDATCSATASSIRTFTIPPIDTCGAHGAPHLVSPVSVTLSSPITFDWNGVDEAIGYLVSIRVDDGALEPLGSTGADVTELTTAVPAGVVSWVVDALFSNCPSVRSEPLTFTVSPLGACEGTAQPVSPAHNSTTSNASIEFTWTSISSASGYRVWLQTGGQAAEVIGSTLGTSLAKTIGTGTHTWWVETLFDGCPSHESSHLTFTITPAQNCDGRGKPSLQSPGDDTTTSSASVTFIWSAVANAIEYELYGALNGGSPTLLGTTGGTSFTTEVPAGTLDWYVRALFSGCDPTVADSRTLVYEPPANCALNTRPVLLAPAEGERVASPSKFDWNDVTGATSYELYVDGQLLATTAVSEATVPRPLGAGTWYVRAKFTANCSALDSTDSRFVIIPQAAACSPLDAPVISAPGQISSGVPALLQWSFVSGATSYVAQLSSDPAFGPGTETSEMGAARQLPLMLDNPGTTPLVRYVRVHAVDSRCTPPTSGPWSDTAVVYILPQSGGEGSTMIGNTTDVEYSLPLPSELAGQTFSATPTAPWITVTPNNGTVPAGGMFLTVVAHTAGLPPGTSIGGVTVATGTAGKLGLHGTTTTPVTVNLVSPVTPTPKNTPPPDALIIPAVANADGIGSHFQSDVRVSNTSAQVMKYQLSYIPSGDAGITAGRQTTFSIEPGRTVALDDILKSWFGTGQSQAIGTLEVRPLTETAKSTINVPVGALANIVTFASSRTFNATPNGTFGQYIPAIPFANFIGKAGDAVKPTILSLQQISQSAKYRTNLGVVEGSGEAASLMVRVFGATGTRLTEFPVNLNGGQHVQLNGFLAQHGINSLDDGRVEVQVVSGNGKVTAYASVLDNATSDPLLVSPVTLSDTNNNKWVMPGVAEIANGAADWRTDMRIFNAGSTPEALTLTFYSMNGGTPQTTQIGLQPGEVRQLDRVLLNTFGVTQNGGAVHITSADPARLIATSRTYNQTTQGTYGQFIAAVTPSEAAAVGSRPLQLLQVEESPRYRSNIGLAEVSGKPVTLEVSIVPPDAKFTATVNVELAANEFRQMNSMLAGLGMGETYNARISIRAIGGEGRATAYASVIDLQTQDPTLVPAQ